MIEAIHVTQSRTALFASLCTTLIVVAALVLYLAPYTIPELTGPFSSHEIVDPAKPDLAAGHMVDDYWAVQSIDGSTAAIGEPRYYQQNYAYLIMGEQRALLFDAGSGTRDNIISLAAFLTPTGERDALAPAFRSHRWYQALQIDRDDRSAGNACRRVKRPVYDWSL
jgi:hypothetical protein